MNDDSQDRTHPEFPDEIASGSGGGGFRDRRGSGGSGGSGGRGAGPPGRGGRDELSGGGDTPPHRGAVVAGCLLAVAALIGVLVVRNHGDKHASPSPVSPSGVRLTPPISIDPGPAPSAARTGPYDSELAFPAAPGLCGQDAKAPFVRADDAAAPTPAAGLTVFVGGSRPAVIAGGQPASWRSLPLTGGADPTVVDGVHRMAHGTLVALVRPCAAALPAGPVYYVPDKGAPRRVAATGSIAVSSNPDDAVVWTQREGAGSFVDISSAGKASAPVSLHGRNVYGVVAAGVLATDVDGGAVTLLDRRTGAAIRSLKTVVPIAAGSSTAAGSSIVVGQPSSCVGTGCPIAVTDVRTGKARSYRVPGAGYALGGAISADGRYLAVTVDAISDGWRPGPGPGSLAVLDLQTGRWQTVAGISLPTTDPAALVWSGRTLLVSVAAPDGSLVASWDTVGKRLRSIATVRGNSSATHAPAVAVWRD